MATQKRASHSAVWVPIIVAIIGVLGSVIVAYITSGSRFEEKFKSMEATIAGLKESLVGATQTSKTLQGGLVSLQQQLEKASADLKSTSPEKTKAEILSVNAALEKLKKDVSQQMDDLRAEAKKGGASKLNESVSALDSRIRNLRVEHNTLNCKSPIESWKGIDTSESRRLGVEYMQRFCSPSYALTGVVDGRASCCSISVVAQ